MAPNRIDKIRTTVRTKLKDGALEAFLAEHIQTLKKRDKLNEAKLEAVAEFKADLKKFDIEIGDQRVVLDRGQLVETDVEVTTHPNGRKTYRRLDTKEKIEDDDMPEQMEIMTGGGDGAEEPEPGEDD